MTATSPAPAAPPVEPADTRAATPQGTRLWVLAAVTATLAFLVYGIALAGSQGAPLSGLPLWAFIAIALAGQQVSLVLQRRGGLAVSPGAVALVLGLLYIQPGLVVLIIAASALVTRLARTQPRAAVATSITLLHVTVAGAVYSAFRFEDPFAWGASSRSFSRSRPRTRSGSRRARSSFALLADVPRTMAARTPQCRRRRPRSAGVELRL